MNRGKSNGFQLGYAAEKKAKAWFRKNGFSADVCEWNFPSPDLLVRKRKSSAVKAIEIKAARRGKDGKWRFCLYKRGHTDYRRSDFVLLMAYTSRSEFIAFLIPKRELGERSTILITSEPTSYGGKWAQYRCSTPCLLS